MNSMDIIEKIITDVDDFAYQEIDYPYELHKAYIECQLNIFLGREMLNDYMFRYVEFVMKLFFIEDGSPYYKIIEEYGGEYDFEFIHDVMIFCITYYQKLDKKFPVK